MKKIKLTKEEIYCGLTDFYKNVGNHFKDDLMGYMFDCRHIEISKDIQDIFYEYYKNKYPKSQNVDITMLLALSGPKVNEALKEYEVEIDDKFMFVANYTDMNVSDEVKDNIEKYFEEYLPQYIVYNVYHFSNHDDDDYLYMVVAKKNTDKEDDYAVWTSWNETTQSLNHGHYDLTKEKIKEVLKENFFDCTNELNKVD